MTRFSVNCTAKLTFSSLPRLTGRLQPLQRQAQGNPDAASPVLTFDKDDEDTLDFVAATANLRSLSFGIETRSKFDIKQMAGNIVPAIATTNAMTAGLCVLQAFKVLRENLSKAKMVFLERSGPRVINTDTLRPPNPNCNVCGVMQSKLIIDPARATLNDLVENVLKLQLGYGDEFSINNEVGTLYDPDLDDNLEKKFSELGVKADSFLTIIDDDDENPRVNLSLSISEKPLPEDAKPVHLLGKLDIARKPKAAPASAPAPPTTTNGDTNGPANANGAGAKRKRNLEDSEDIVEQDPKRGKAIRTSLNSNEDVGITDGSNNLTIADSGNGAIVIDDD